MKACKGASLLLVIYYAYGRCDIGDSLGVVLAVGETTFGRGIVFLP